MKDIKVGRRLVQANVTVVLWDSLLESGEERLGYLRLPRHEEKVIDVAKQQAFARLNLRKTFPLHVRIVETSTKLTKIH